MLGLYGCGGPQFQWRYSNHDVPSSTPGTAVTLGTSNAEGSWVQIASSANIANDVYLFAIAVGSNYSSGYNLNTCLDVGVDPAGGSSYTEVIQNIICGKGSNIIGYGFSWFVFPLFIKAGSSVAVRGSTSHTTGAPRVPAVFYGRPRNPHLVRAAQYCEGVGAVTNNAGVSFTPGNGAEGSWASLGTTVRPCWWWQLGIDINNATITVQYTHVDLAVGDGTNYDIIAQNLPLHFGGTTEVATRGGPEYFLGGYWEVPAGATLYVRARCSTAPASGYNARALGFGG